MAGEKLLDPLPLLPRVEVGAEEPFDDDVDLLARYPAQHRPADRRLAPEPAAEEEVVALPPLALGAALAERRPLEADVAGPVVGAGVGAAVEVEPQVRRPLAEGRLQVGDDGRQ